MPRVLIASPLRSYTQGAAAVEAEGGTVEALLDNLERRFSGIRFRMIDEQDRIRPHIRIYVNTAEARDLRAEVAPGDQVHLICALSGG